MSATNRARPRHVPRARPAEAPRADPRRQRAARLRAGLVQPPGLAVTTAVLTCVAFVLIAPLAFRLLFPEEERTPLLALRIAVYAALAVVVNLTLEVFLPRALGVGRTFLSDKVSVAVSLALFVVGGWGLGRDIGFEASLAAERARAAAFAKEAEAAQLLALRSHFDPHFLFNTLNAIAEWCREDGETAEKAILALSSMLREVLQGVRAPTWPLERELGLLDALFSLHGIRDPLAFTVLRGIEPGVSALPIVPLLLLPLAENAVKHGPAAGKRGVIRVSARATDDTLAIEDREPWPLQGALDPGATGCRSWSGGSPRPMGTRGAWPSPARRTTPIAPASRSRYRRAALLRESPYERAQVVVADDEGDRAAPHRAAAPRDQGGRARGRVQGRHGGAAAGRAGGSGGAEDIDVLLLDIQMPGLTGLEAMALLPERCPYVIFCTAHAEHAVHAFDVGAVDYLLKPFEADGLRSPGPRALPRGRRRFRRGTPAPRAAG